MQRQKQKKSKGEWAMMHVCTHTRARTHTHTHAATSHGEQTDQRARTWRMRLLSSWAFFHAMAVSSAIKCSADLAMSKCVSNAIFC